MLIIKTKACEAYMHTRLDNLVKNLIRLDLYGEANEINSMIKTARPRPVSIRQAERALLQRGCTLIRSTGHKQYLCPNGELFSIPMGAPNATMTTHECSVFHKLIKRLDAKFEQPVLEPKPSLPNKSLDKKLLLDQAEQTLAELESKVKMTSEDENKWVELYELIEKLSYEISTLRY